MEKAELISIVIPNHNRADYVLELLKSISRQDYTNFETIVVDDGSNDNSVEAIQNELPSVELVVLDDNRGPAAARNEGIIKANGSIIVGLDSDVVLGDENMLTKIAEKFSKSDKLDCLALRIMNYYSSKDDVKTWHHPLHIRDYAGREFFTDYFSGTAYAFRKRVFEKAGLFPQEFFMHGEENDLAYRVLDAGFDIVYCPDIAVLHKLYRPSSNNQISLYYHRRNQMWIAAKYFPFFKAVFFLMPRLLKSFAIALTKGGIKTYCCSLRDGVNGLKNAIKMRKPLKSQTWRKIRLIRKGLYGRPFLRRQTMPKNLTVAKNETIKICIACSAGGHLVQARELAEVYEKYNHFYFTFSGGVANKLKETARVRTAPDIVRGNPLTWLVTAASSLYVAASERPDIVITTGAGVTIFFCLFAKLFGAKLIYIESMAKVNRPTLTSRALYPFADMFIVQWPGLVKFFPKARFLGRLF